MTGLDATMTFSNNSNQFISNWSLGPSQVHETKCKMTIFLEVILVAYHCFIQSNFFALSILPLLSQANWHRQVECFAEMNELAKPHKGLDSPSIYAGKVPTQEHVARAIMNTLYNMIKTRQKSLALFHSFPS